MHNSRQLTLDGALEAHGHCLLVVVVIVVWLGLACCDSRLEALQRSTSELLAGPLLATCCCHVVRDWSAQTCRNNIGACNLAYPIRASRLAGCGRSEALNNRWQSEGLRVPPIYGQ